MAIKEIVIYPNDILSTPTKKTDLKTAQNIAVDLFKTLNAEGGLGLSANQIGEDKSVCVVNVTEPFFLQNPKIVKKEKEIIYKEGCLSIPDKMFKTNSYTANDLLILEAVCVQHEIDHLNGLTIYDREHKLEQYKRTERKIGRNEKVTITKDKETLTLKYKKAIPYLEKGWVINGQT